MALVHVVQNRIEAAYAQSDPFARCRRLDGRLVDAPCSRVIGPVPTSS